MHDSAPLAGLDLSALAEAIELDSAPYSSRFSRLLVLSADGMATWAGRSRRDSACAGGTQPLTVLRSAYERPAAQSVVVDELRLHTAEGVSWWQAGADGVQFASGARLLVTDDDRVVVTGLRAGDVLEMRPLLPEQEAAETPLRPTAAERLTVDGSATVEIADGMLRLHVEGAAAMSWAAIPSGPVFENVTATELADRHDRILADWLRRVPRVGPARQKMVDLCWWVLGNNTLHLAGSADEAGERAAVVPSKLGYVGLWQWDAYFIALGLRHGDPGLARTQIAIALAHARPDGQLPDVVHDYGVLDSSDDLPPGDLENLRGLASPTLAGGPVPLTKPPLTALTLDLLAAQLGDALIEEHVETVLASQRWWFEHSDPGATGWPAYLHPYSSGLDDSPVFDNNAILRSPDLAAYLISQDRLLARWLEERGQPAEAAQCRSRSDRLRLLLEDCWDSQRQLFVLPGEDTEVTTRSILNLIALLIPELRTDICAALRDQITDPHRFGGGWMLPTVSRDDPDFSAERMWRGPIWVNTAWLVIQGLRVQGENSLAEEVTENVLDLVMHAGGPSEYYNPDTGRKARTATVLFGWSSALFVEMAVQAAAAPR